MELREQITIELKGEKGQLIGLPARNYVAGIASLLLTILCAFFVVHRLNPPDAQPVSAPGTEFASGRAREHIEMIAKKPHPVGAEEHSRVRDYIFKELADLGLSPEVQRSSVLKHQSGGPDEAATVQNIIGIIKGAENGQAILFVSHYDSVPTGPGASDDGSGVAALLEVIRALKTGSPLKNDIRFLFSDGEEIGMLGAKAFVDESPYAKDVAAVLNFEARGIGGPSIMFETSEGNEWLIKEFGKTVSHPVANSLTSDLYGLLGNDTDLTVFKGKGLRGLNFAFIMGQPYYHTTRDSYENIDERSLQHSGSYALALARHFGNVSAWPERASNIVYFDIFSYVLVSYSERLVLPLMTLTLLLFTGLVILGFRMKRLTIGGITFGAFGFLLNVIGVGALLLIVMQVIQRVSSSPTADDYIINRYAVGFLLLTVALSSALLVWFNKKARPENLAVGGLIWWAVLMVLVCLLAPGGSYLFTWPLMLAVLALGAVLIAREKITSVTSIIILTIPALSSVILIAPLIRLMVAGFGLNMAWVLMAFVVFQLALLNAHLRLLTATKKWLLPAASGLLGLCFIGAGLLLSGVSANQPKTDHLFYAVNADTGKAIWGSVDQSLDEWTSQYFSSGAEKVELADYLSVGRGQLLKGDAPALSLAPPSVVMLEDRREGGLRTLRLRVTSPRRASGLSIFWKQELELKALAVNGKRTEEENVETPRAPGHYRRLSYYGPPEEGIELSLEIRSSDPIELKIEEWLYGLPEIPGRLFTGRPDYIFAAPILYSDCTVITKSVTF